MGFFNDLKEDLVSAVNELTDDKAEQEIAKNEEHLRDEIAKMEEEDRKSKKKSRKKVKNESLEEEIQNILDGIDENVAPDDFEEIVEMSDEFIEDENIDINASVEDIINEVDDVNYDDAMDETQVDTEINDTEINDIVEDQNCIEEAIVDEATSVNEFSAFTPEVFKELSDVHEIEKEDTIAESALFVAEENSEVVESFDSTEVVDDFVDSVVDTIISDEETNDEITEDTFTEENTEDIEVNEVEEVMEESVISIKVNDQPVPTMNEAFDNEVTVITKGTVIAGDITTDAGLEIKGRVTGNVETSGKLVVSGSINGNSKATEVFLDGADIRGDITTEGSLKVADGSVIIGNIKASCAVVAGAIKGNIDVNGAVVLDSTAKVLGDITCKLVQINNGAVIEGNCSQSYAEVSPTKFFENIV